MTKKSHLREMVKDREAWRAAVHGVTRGGHTTERLNNSNDKEFLKLFFPLMSKI